MQISRSKPDSLHRTPAGSTVLVLDGYGLCDILPARPTSAASYPVSVRRVATVLHASFRRSLAVPPLRFASASPPSGCTGNFHPQTVGHVRHTGRCAPAIAGRLRRSLPRPAAAVIGGGRSGRSNGPFGRTKQLILVQPSCRRTAAQGGVWPRGIVLSKPSGQGRTALVSEVYSTWRSPRWHAVPHPSPYCAGCRPNPRSPKTAWRVRKHLLSVAIARPWSRGPGPPR
jgi:hypothetical protein